MFFADNLLTDKKSPLGIAWLAATLGPKNANKRVNKKEISKYDLVNACEYISEPPEPLALRTSGILLYGVARVYNQHYEEFQQHVTRFHADVHRAVQTNFATTINGRIAGNQGIDSLDGGKSKLDAITFAGIDFGWQSGIDYEMRFISTHDGEEEESEEEDEDSENPRAPKKHKSASPYGITPKRPSPHISDRRSHDLLDEPIFDGELELFNLDELEDPGTQPFPDAGGDPNSSFSVPDDLGAMGDISMDINMEDGVLFHPDVLGAPAKESKTPRTPKSARKRQRDSADMSEVEEMVVDEKKKRVKKPKKATLDKQGTEMNDEDLTQALNRYRLEMTEKSADQKAQKAEKEADEVAMKLVDAAGNWAGFIDGDMAELFGGITHVPKFKWELDLAAAKLGTACLPGEDDEDMAGRGKRKTGAGEGHERDQEGGEEGMVDGNGQGMGMGDVDDPFMDTVNNDTTTYQDYNQDYMEPLHDPSSRPERDGSLDVEAARRATLPGRVSLPWDTKSDNGSDDIPAGADSSFDAPSLQLTNMTPQEARLRLSSKSLSKTGSLGPLARRAARSRSGSVLDGRASQPAQMLIGGDEDDDSLPQDFKDMADEPSQIVQLPDAYRPEMMAMLDMQCRLFLQFVEKRMVTDETDEVEFDDICPPEKTKKSVACQAFYNVLNLTTKKILKVDQPEAFDSFSIQFTAQLKI